MPREVYVHPETALLLEKGNGCAVLETFSLVLTLLTRCGVWTIYQIFFLAFAGYTTKAARELNEVVFSNSCLQP